MSERVEAVASEIHAVYQQEAHRQSNVRHASLYADLPENIKEYDRVLARWILQREDALREERDRLAGLLAASDILDSLQQAEQRVRELEGGVVIETVYGEPVMDHGYKNGEVVQGRVISETVRRYHVDTALTDLTAREAALREALKGVVETRRT